MAPDASTPDAQTGPAPQKRSGPFVISVDAMGGDRGPAAVVSGIARSAKKNPDIAFILHGPKDQLLPLVKRRKVEDRVTINHVEGVVTMDAKPSHVMRHGKGTSMWETIEAVRNGEAEVAVSCGNTGALMGLSMVRLRKIEGVNRPAIACLWPAESPSGFNVMLDVGADIRADARDLLQYALMGTSYARNGLGIKEPRVGLLNVGTEEYKGRPELKEANDLMEAAAARAGFRYVGFIEGGDIPKNRADVIVTDGFTGNVALKTTEGTASLIAHFLRRSFSRSLWSRLQALVARSTLAHLRTTVDPRAYNGASFVGLNGIVIKSHGGADAIAFEHAIETALLEVRDNVPAGIARWLASEAA